MGVRQLHLDGCDYDPVTLHFDDEFWAIVAASFTVGEYTDLVDRCKVWIRVMA